MRLLKEFIFAPILLGIFFLLFLIALVVYFFGMIVGSKIDNKQRNGTAKSK